MTDNPYTTPVETKPKESWIAYVLWFCFVPFGGHRFYIERDKTLAIVQLVLTCTLVGILVSLPWAIVDLFLIPKMVRERNAELATQWDHRHRAELVDSSEFVGGAAPSKAETWNASGANWEKRERS